VPIVLRAEDDSVIKGANFDKMTIVFPLWRSYFETFEVFIALKMFLNILNQFTDYKLKSIPNSTYFKTFVPFSLCNKNVNHCQFLCQLSERVPNTKSLLRCKKKIIIYMYSTHLDKTYNGVWSSLFSATTITVTASLSQNIIKH
jgi:hypothetical protein